MKYLVVDKKLQTPIGLYESMNDIYSALCTVRSLALVKNGEWYSISDIREVTPNNLYVIREIHPMRYFYIISIPESLENTRNIKEYCFWECI